MNGRCQHGVKSVVALIRGVADALELANAPVVSRTATRRPLMGCQVGNLQGCHMMPRLILGLFWAFGSRLVYLRNASDLLLIERVILIHLVLERSQIVHYVLHLSLQSLIIYAQPLDDPTRLLDCLPHRRGLAAGRVAAGLDLPLLVRVLVLALLLGESALDRCAYQFFPLGFHRSTHIGHPLNQTLLKLNIVSGQGVDALVKDLV